MKGLLISSFTLILAGASAYAADASRKMPVKAPPKAAPAPVIFSWTGCYLGGHIGGGWGQKSWSDPIGLELSTAVPLFADLSLNQHVSGLLGGGQAGCRLQLAPSWVAGIDGEFSSARIVGSSDLTPFVSPPGVGIPTTIRSQADWLASATGIFGYARDGLLVYAKGGAAWVRDKYAVVATPQVRIVPADFEASETRAGWIVGGGVEYAFWKGLSAKLEYDFYDFGNRRVQFLNQAPTAASPVGEADINQRIHAIKFGLNYNFWNATAPAPATSIGLVTKASPLKPAAEPAASVWSETFSSEVRYFSWQSTRPFPNNLIKFSSQPVTAPGSGTELYIPYATQLVGQPGDFKVELLARGGWVEARQSTEGVTGEVRTATDTVASGTFTYLGLQGIQPFASLNLNLPTGLVAPPGTAPHARMDPDLVDIASFGEGLNVGPTLGFNLPIASSLILSASAGYTQRGSFDRESSLTPLAPGGPAQVPTSIEPGKVLTITGSVGYQAGQLSGQLTGAVSQETATMENGMPFVRPGRRYLAAGTWNYTWPQQNAGVTTLSASAAHANRNDVLFVFTGAPTSLITESTNTNSNVYRVGLEHVFLVGKAVFGPTGSFLFRDHNGYDPTTVQFVPAKERWSVGGLVRFAATETLIYNARVERVWIREDENPALPGDSKFSVLANAFYDAFTVPVISSTGWQFAVGATAKF